MNCSKHWPAKDATEMHLQGLFREDPRRAQFHNTAATESIIVHVRSDLVASFFSVTTWREECLC
jgi:hypothetical protein